MLHPPRSEPPPAEVRYIPDSQPAHLPTPVLVMEALGKMPTPTAITIILTAAGMTLGAVVAIVALLGIVLATLAAIVGTVALGALGVGVAAIMLGGRPVPPTR
jgi:hypothetical protein